MLGSKLKLDFDVFAEILEEVHLGEVLHQEDGLGEVVLLVILLVEVEDEAVEHIEFIVVLPKSAVLGSELHCLLVDIFDDLVAGRVEELLRNDLVVG